MTDVLTTISERQSTNDLEFQNQIFAVSSRPSDLQIEQCICVTTYIFPHKVGVLKVTDSVVGKPDCGSAHDAHCKPLFKPESILTVVNVYIFRCLLNIKKNLNDYTPISAVHSYPN